MLIDLAAAAKHPIIVVNDADIRVEPDYLARVTAPLADPRVGLVTCLYRAIGSNFAARFEGLGRGDGFRAVGAGGAAGGRRRIRDGIDAGFPARRSGTHRRVRGDCGLSGRRLSAGASDARAGIEVRVVAMWWSRRISAETWSDVWAHQVRWARTIRVSKFGGYLGLPVTYATLWAVIALAFGQWQIALALLACAHGDGDWSQDGLSCAAAMCCDCGGRFRCAICTGCGVGRGIDSATRWCGAAGD